ncbi:hypothetical protein AaE_007692 [Aphanomyces astaci]|uniref:Uncharacterized protein n=1 Tax=Aphanomyces astaci TaxID=112090 RepID=A0A6A5AA46_APHAT|nr:hypothetical protein AaE_007692 [Aphanomyces astaci]
MRVVGANRRRMLIVLAIVLVCGTVATALGVAHFVFVTKVDNQAKAILSGLQHTPGVYVTLTVKRASMRLNGVSTAEAYIFPRGGPNLDGALSFDAVLTHRNEDVVTTYTLVNTRAYVTTSSISTGAIMHVSCLEASQVPPIHMVRVAIFRVDVLNVFIR